MQTRIQCEAIDKARRDAKIPIVVDETLSLARVQYEERLQRRAELERELSGKDAQECMSRVILRMRNGDKIWIPPMFNREHWHRKWLKKQRKQGNVSVMEARR